MTTSAAEILTLLEKLDIASVLKSDRQMELLKTKLANAYEFGQLAFLAHNRRFDEEVENFPRNFALAQAKAKKGWTKRKDMPVINIDDVREFQRRMSQGAIDLRAPFTDHASKRNPFPQGLTGDRAAQWLEQGLPVHDGSDRDDVVKTYFENVPVKELKPIQAQIYVDKSLLSVARSGTKSFRDYVKNKSILIASKDNYILDGHHRFLSSILVDPDMESRCLKVDLPIAELLPLTLAYGDAIGNPRNR